MPYMKRQYDTRDKGERGDRDKDEKRPFFRKRICRFCVEKIEAIDYKDPMRLQKFITERGKILPSRISGACAKHQRRLTRAIKQARSSSLLPFTGE